MSTIEAIILGIIQGLTEFIPISSSGHLVIAQYYMSGASDHLFLEWINIGTVLALLIFFRHRIGGIITGIIRRHDYRLAINVVIAMIPAGLAGFLLADFIETSAFFGSIWTVVATLIIVGIVMVVLERLPKLSPVKDEASLPRSRALTIGLAQMAALIPGTSRSGATIITGRLMGLNAATAAEFSFLVSIPIMLGVLLKLSVKAADRAYFVDNASAIIIGNIFALIAGLIAVGFLMRYLQRHSLALFGWYRIALGSIIALVLILA
ncbi:undecaprenyl-diphosphate phosphatase [Pedobacter sp.]|nr:undecaprenyl-diphosphate phosphatase [Candidatus Saccharibacteria bacterium]